MPVLIPGLEQVIANVIAVAHQVVVELQNRIEVYVEGSGTSLVSLTMDGNDL